MEKKIPVLEKWMIVFLIGTLAQIWKISEMDSGFKYHARNY